MSDTDPDMIFFLVSLSFSDQSYVDLVMVLLIPENLGQLRSPQAAVKRSLKLLDRMFQMNDVYIYFCPFQQQLGQAVTFASLTNVSHLMTKPTKWLCAQQRLRSAWASAQSYQSLHCPHEESLDP